MIVYVCSEDMYTGDHEVKFVTKNWGRARAWQELSRYLRRVDKMEVED